MDVTRAAIEKNRVTLTALVVVLAAGIMAYLNIPRAEDPGFTIRTAVVVTYFPGASPERVELLVTDKLEKAVQEIPELDFVKSSSKTGASVIHVNIKESYTEMRPIWDSLRRKVERARSELPDNVVGPFVNDEFGDVFGIVLTISGPDFSYAELKDFADQTRDQLLFLRDVAKVDIYGAQEERVFVEYNNARLAEFGLSPLQLKSILENRNILIPGGSVTVGGQRIVLEPSGNFESVDDLKRTVITLPGRQELVYLEDLAEVRRAYVDPPTAKVTSSGEAALALAVSMREGGNIIELGEQVEPVIQRVRDRSPLGLTFDVVAFQPTVVDVKVKDFVGNILQAIAIVVAVMLLMLGFRTGVVVASLIPSAIVMSLLVMSYLGIGLDQISLASLIIALGMLVDNAIVMSESIMVRMAAGQARVEAAVDSAAELKIPLLTSSLTTSAAFLPIFLAEASVGEYTASLFKVVTITLLCSWVLAITVIPLLCVLFLKVAASPEADTFNTRFYRGYRALLLTALRHRFITLGLALGLLALSVQGMDHLPTIFFPPSDTPMFTAELELPVGTDISRTEEVVKQVDRFVGERLSATAEGGVGVTVWASFIGQGGPRFVLTANPKQPTSEYAYMILSATSRTVIPRLVARLEEFAREAFPDLRTTIKPLANGPIINNPVEVRLSGPEEESLFGLVDQVKETLRSTPGAKDIGDDWGVRAKKLVVRVDEARARRSGVTNQDVAISLQTGLSGFVTTDYREGDEIIPITLRSTEADRSDIGKLEGLNVFSQLTGQSVPLKQVAEVEVAWQAAQVLRRNRYKTVTVYANLDPGTTPAEVTDSLIPWLESVSGDWPLGYRWAMGGELETSGTSNQAILAKLPVAGLLILLLLVGQFNSLRKPLIILLTIPLGLIGVVAGLLLFRSYFGFMTLLGIISLAGIVINNAIVLLDRIQIEISENGLPPARAVIESAQRRLRPILLTTATTVGGLIPLYLGGGPMWEPMALAIIFGLLFATVLTLAVVPALYSIFFRVRFKGFSYES